ncbi:MAG: carbamoyltransferase HypF [Gammaproteobacteria bacterium]|nr:carbamoyltransferase HypF [Gammaproteobacteria bacterium]
MKNTIALAWENRMVISPHVGELDTKRSIGVFNEVINKLCDLYQVKPEQVVSDLHPNYYSTKYAKTYAQENNLSLLQIQHHQAHANMVYDQYLNQTAIKDDIPWLVFTWDGTGLGEDKAIWGAEAFYGHYDDWHKVCSIKPFKLQGGDQSARNPWRCASSLIWQINKDLETQYSLPEDWIISTSDIELSYQAWKKNINTISCSSMGRLFDAASALIGLGEKSSFEGQGPMLLEGLCEDGVGVNQLKIFPKVNKLNKSNVHRSSDNRTLTPTPKLPHLPLYKHHDLLLADWTELVHQLMNKNLSQKQRAIDFHHKIAATLIEQAKQIRKIKGNFKVGLSGGVFQNKYLTELVLKGLKDEGFIAYLPGKIPYNDAGLVFGQIVYAACIKK